MPDEPTCSSCSISAQLVAVLGSESEPADLGDVFRVDVGPHGNYWVFSQGMMPKVFDSKGNYVATVGSPGQGPGEMQVPTQAWRLPGDSVIVRDAGVSLHLFGPDLRYVRTLRSPVLGVRDAVILEWPSAVVVNALDPTPSRVAYPLHLLDFSQPTGRVRRSFWQGDEPITQSSMYSMLAYQLTPARNGGYWAAAGGIYSITKWSSTHDEIFTLDRRPPWFSERSDMLEGGPEKAPSPTCQGVDEDENGSVWSFCLIASPRYRDAWNRVADMLRSNATVEIPANAIDYHLLHFTRIEVLDPSSRRVIATGTINERVLSVLPNREVATVAYSDEGIPKVRILRFRLNGRTR